RSSPQPTAARVATQEKKRAVCSKPPAQAFEMPPPVVLKVIEIIDICSRTRNERKPGTANGSPGRGPPHEGPHRPPAPRRHLHGQRQTRSSTLLRASTAPLRGACKARGFARTPSESFRYYATRPPRGPKHCGLIPPPTSFRPLQLNPFMP